MSEKIKQKLFESEICNNISDSLSKTFQTFANEPTAGLFFAKEHINQIIPDHVSIQEKFLQKSREIHYSSRDAEGAILQNKELLECLPIVTEVSDKIKALTSQLEQTQQQQQTNKSDN